MTKPLDALPVHRIDLDSGRKSEPLEQTARLYVQRVAEPVLHLNRVLGTLTVILAPIALLLTIDAVSADRTDPPVRRFRCPGCPASKRRKPSVTYW